MILATLSTAEKPDKERYDQGDNNRGCQGKVEGEIVTLNTEISGKLAYVWYTAAKSDDKADQNQQ
jgi:hypothetical protein